MPEKVPFYKSRSLRTALLAITATATFVGCAIVVFEVHWRVMLNLLLASLLGLGLIMVAALAVTGLREVFRRWRER